MVADGQGGAGKDPRQGEGPRSPLPRTWTAVREGLSAACHLGRDAEVRSRQAMGLCGEESSWQREQTANETPRGTGRKPGAMRAEAATQSRAMTAEAQIAQEPEIGADS